MLEHGAPPSSTPDWPFGWNLVRSEVYRHVARMGSNLYFLIAQLKQVRERYCRLLPATER